MNNEKYIHIYIISIQKKNIITKLYIIKNIKIYQNGFNILNIDVINIDVLSPFRQDLWQMIKLGRTHSLRGSSYRCPWGFSWHFSSHLVDTPSWQIEWAVAWSPFLFNALNTPLSAHMLRRYRTVWTCSH